MAKTTRKSNTPAPKVPVVPAGSVLADTPLGRFLANTRLQGLLIFGLAFLLYANTLGHGFVLDDSIVITENMYTEQGVAGIGGILSKDTFFGYFKVEGKETLVSGGRYRPLSLVFFAILHQIAGASPFVFHLFTVLLFASCCLVLYHTLRYLFLLRMGDGYAATAAWLAAVLFTVHPVHTEVVANIKGSDELLTLLGSLGALWLSLLAFDRRSWGVGALAGLVFFLACLAKENAATFVVVIPLALWFFRDMKPSDALRYSLPAWGGFLAFFLLRGSILQWAFGAQPMELMNNPFLKIDGAQWVPYTFSEKMATIFYTLGKYVQLLVWPHPLTHDYYPRTIGMKTFADPMVLLSAAGYVGMAVYALLGLGKRDVVRFGILFYLLTLSIVSNVVFPIGTNMGERFIFMPSLGFCVVAADMLLRLLRNPVVVLAPVALFFAGLTLLRNPVWESNEKLFFADVETSENSAKIQNACGGVLFEKALAEKDLAARDRIFQQAFTHANKAVEIYPNYKDALITRAGAQYYLKNFEGAIADYRLAARIAGNDPKPQSYLAIALRDAGQFYGEQKGDLAKAEQYLNESWQINPKDAATARLLGVAQGVQGAQARQAGRLDVAQQFNLKALEWFKLAAGLAPEDANILYDLGTAYYLVGDPAQSAQWHQKAFELDPALKASKGVQ
jgi:protein O-mannosyl-transferase